MRLIGNVLDFYAFGSADSIANPKTGYKRLYAKDGDHLYFQNDAGTEFILATEGWVSTNYATSGHTHSDLHSHTNKTTLDGISSTDVSNWNTAYGWGDHASVGYITDITAENLGDLSDVSLAATPAANSLFQYTSGTWSDVTLGSISLSSFNDDLSYIPSSEKGAANGVATLDSGSKVPVSQLPNSIMEYMGTWNADTNTPTLADGDTANAGHVYRVTTAGSTTFSAGNTISFNIGDYAVCNASGTWEKSDTTDSVQSVFGIQGSVAWSDFSTITSVIKDDGILLYESAVKTSTIGSLQTYMQNNLAFNDYTHPNHTGDVTSSGDGATSLTASAITGKTAITSGLVGTDELLLSDAGTLKRMDVSVLQSYMQNNLAFDDYTHPTFNGDDISISQSTTGGTVIDGISITITTTTEGHVEVASGSATTRTLTAANVGAIATGTNWDSLSNSGTAEYFYKSNGSGGGTWVDIINKMTYSESGTYTAGTSYTIAATTHGKGTKVTAQFIDLSGTNARGVYGEYEVNASGDVIFTPEGTDQQLEVIIRPYN